MNNPFATLAQPLVCRPGDALPTEPRRAPVPQKPRRDIPPCENPWGLSAAQCEVIRMSCDGKTARQIGAELGISHKTVEVHFMRLKDKMDASTLLQAALIWDRHFRKEPA